LGCKRGRRLRIGDLCLQALANHVTFDNVELVKRCLYLFAAMNTTEGLWWMVLAHVMNVEENRTIMTRAVKGAVSCKRYFSTLYVPSRDRGSF